MDHSPSPKFDFRAAIALLLLAPAVFFTLRVNNELTQRRYLREDLAEIGHVRYGLFNANEWVRQMLPIIDKQVDALDLTAQNAASLRPMVEKSLYRLLDQVKEQIAPAPKPGAPPPGFAAAATALMANSMISQLRPQVPRFAGVVLTELTSPDNKKAIKQYIAGIITDGAKNTFSPVDMTRYNAILSEHHCADAAACRGIIGDKIRQRDDEIREAWMAALGATALAFILVLAGPTRLRWYHTLVLLFFCVTLLAGGVLSPMLEVEAKLSRLSLTFFGQPIAFNEQIFYYQSKTVLEVFHTLIQIGQPEMDLVAVLLITFSVFFPALKILTLTVCLGRPEWLRKYRLAKFFALESSKWSMADVLALAIFMSFVAFNGVISSAMGNLQAPGAQIVIPTDSSKILAGFYLFVGFVLCSLFLSWKIDRTLKTVYAQSVATASE